LNDYICNAYSNQQNVHTFPAVDTTRENISEKFLEKLKDLPDSQTIASWVLKGL
jgi:hypothetical protein